MLLLPNLKSLGFSMNRGNWISQGFPFTLNKIHCDVLCINKSPKPNITKMLFKFISNDSVMTLDVKPYWIKSTDGKDTWSEIKAFFHINSSKYFNHPFEWFCNKLNSYIPTKARGPKNSHEADIIASYDEPDNANKKYCCAIKNNGGGTRTSGNNEKARVLRNDLWHILFDGVPGKMPIPGISFVFSEYKSKRRSDKYIIRRAVHNCIFNTKSHIPLSKLNQLTSLVHKWDNIDKM